MINGNACFAYFNKIWGIPRRSLRDDFVNYIEGMCESGRSIMAIAVAFD